MANLMEESVWTSPIYRIERNDPVMGGVYGVNNVQARQLANRTKYLLERFLAEHREDGTHALSEKSIAALAGIAESKLVLDHPTQKLYEEAQKCVELLATLSDDLNALVLLENTSFGPLYQALLLSWKYGYPRFAFELFTGAFSLRDDFTPVPLLESIAGDDSIDVLNSETLNVDETYVIWDREQENSVFATIKKILTDERVILYSEENRTRYSTGSLVKTSWVPTVGCAKAKKDSLYVSRDMDLLKGLTKGNLLIAHNEGAEFYAEVQRIPTQDITYWERLPLISRIYSEEQQLWRTVYETPGGCFRFRIRALTDATISHIVLMSDAFDTFSTTVRTPEVVDRDFTITRFGALYGAKHVATHFMLSKSADFTGESRVTLNFGKDLSKNPVWDYKLRVIDKNPVSRGDEIYWRAWYDASDGFTSNMSAMGHYIHEAI